MRYARNHNGIALMMVLVVAAIALAIMGTLIHMVISGTQVSGMHKRFASAREASEGGKGIIYEYVDTRGLLNASSFTGINFQVASSSTCIYDKLNKKTSDWDSSCDASLLMDPSDTNSYDLSFDLGDYQVTSKIVNTVEGNSGPGGYNLDKGGVVTANSGEVPVAHVPYLYAMEIDATNTKNPAEKACLSVLLKY
ncbi:MAG: hypothetical protein P8Y66_04495 [Nitrospirota bacterium]|jgi:hypothetical protein